jgi:hypothetical protein
MNHKLLFAHAAIALGVSGSAFGAQAGKPHAAPHKANAAHTLAFDSAKDRHASECLADYNLDDKLTATLRNQEKLKHLSPGQIDSIKEQVIKLRATEAACGKSGWTGQARKIIPPIRTRPSTPPFSGPNSQN